MKTCCTARQKKSTWNAQVQGSNRIRSKTNTHASKVIGHWRTSMVARLRRMKFLIFLIKFFWWKCWRKFFFTNLLLTC